MDAIAHCQSAAMGEVNTCYQGLKITPQNSTSNLIIEIDCASILEAFKEDRCDRSEVCLIAKDFKFPKVRCRSACVKRPWKIVNKTLLLD
jgi:hypothetical protein